MSNPISHHDRSKSLTRVVAVPGPSPGALELSSAGPTSVDLAQLWSLLRRHAAFILGMGLLSLALVMGITLVSRMQFRSTGRLYLGELDLKPRAPGSSSQEIDLAGDAQGDVWSEVEIMSSRALITRAVLASGLNVDVARHGARPVRYGEWLAARRDPDLVDSAARELRATNTQISSRHRTPPEYRAKFSSAEEYELFDESKSLGKGRIGAPLVAGDLKLTLLKGLEAAPKAGSDYQLTVSTLDDVTERAAKALDVSVPKASNTNEPVKVVSLTFTAGSPRQAASFLEALMQGYLEERRSWKTEDATAAETFVTKQLQGVRASLDQLQKKLADYRTSNRAVVLDNEAKVMIEQVGKYEEQRVAARLQVAALNDIKKALKDPNPPLGAYLLGEADDTVLEGLATSLTKARQKLTDLESRFNAASPDLQEQQAQVNSQLEAIRNYVSSRLARAQENQAALGGLIGQFEARLKTVPGAEIGLAQLSRESEVYSRLYSYLLERQQQMAIVKASTVSKNRILDAPEPALREDSPKLALRLASGPLGLLLGTLLVVLRAFAASTFQSEAELKRGIGNLAIFASVPRRRRLAARRGSGSRLHPVFERHSWDFEEAFRTLRTNLYHQRGGEPPRVILVTSAKAGDGKTTCALGLAALLAADNKKVLVIDADLRRPNLHARYGKPDLDAALSNDCDWREALHRVSSPFGDFDSIGASEPAPPELLSSPNMTALLDEARARYDFILLDAPSFPLVSDALVLAVAADCVLSVVRLGSTPRRLIAEHLSRVSLSARYQAVIANEVSTGKPTSRQPPAVRSRVSETTLVTDNTRTGITGRPLAQASAES